MTAANWATPEEIARLQGAAQARTKRRRATPEQTFTDNVKRYARRGGWLCYHTLRSKGSDPGLPDLILIRGNRLVVAELKVPPNVRYTDWQRCWLTAFEILARLAGPFLSIEVYRWTPEDYPVIERVLE
jgi:hypothetical protein